MDVKQKKDILSYALHESTESELIEALAQEADEVFYPKKSQILGMGESQRYVYLIIKGLARSYYINENGNDITKLFMQENEFMLGEALFMEESLEVFETVEDVLGLRFRSDKLKAILLSSPESMRGYISLPEQTIIYKTNREYNFQCLNATERYLAFRKIYPGIEDRIPQNHIASYLGIAKESLSRIRKKLSEN